MRRPFPDPSHKQAPVQALEKGIEPELVTERISELREGKKALEQALTELGAERKPRLKSSPRSWHGGPT